MIHIIKEYKYITTKIRGFMGKIGFWETTQNLYFFVNLTLTKQSITIQIKTLALFLKDLLNS